MAAGTAREFSEFPTKEEMETIVKCIVCHDFPLPPIHQCKKGHNICGTCRPKLDKCALCQSSFVGGRNFALEAIVEASSFKCDWQEEGCKDIIRGSDLKAHLEQCQFRPIKCQFGIFDGCRNSIVNISKYLQHMKDVHEFIILSFANGRMCVTFSPLVAILKQDKLRWDCKLVTFDDHKFVSFIFKQNSVIYFSVAILGEEEEAQNYSVKLSFSQSPSDPIVYEATIPVVSYRNSLDDMIHHPNVSFTFDALKKIGKITTTPIGEAISWRVVYDIITRHVRESTVTKRKRISSIIHIH